MTLKVLNGVDNNGQRLQNVADPSSATDAANKQYVDNVAAGLDWKDNVRVASTGNINVSAPGTSIDGVTLSNGDRVLLKNQTTGSENGIYQFNGSASALTRTTDADSSADIKNAIVRVAEGTTNADSMWQLVTDSVTLGTTSQTWTQFSGGGTAYVAGNGLTESPAGTFNVGAGTGVSVAADSVGVDTSVVVRKYAANCVATTNPQTFNHALNNTDPMVMVKEVSTGKIVIADVTVSDANNVSVDFGGAPTSGQYRVIVQA